MIEIEKPNPFQILKLPIHATNEEIVARWEELSLLAKTPEQQHLYQWASEQLITNPATRLEYEIFEVPSSLYEDDEWERFQRKHRKNPITAASLMDLAEPVTEKDFDFAKLIDIFLDGLFAPPEPDISAILLNPPFFPEWDSELLEVRHVIFG